MAWLVSEPDQGRYYALNKGLARARGEVVGVLHGDDVFGDPEVLARVAAAFADPAVMAVYGDLEYVSRTDPGRVVRHWRSRAFEPGLLRRGWMPPHPTLYLRRSVYERLGGFDTRYRIAADYDLILRVLGQLPGRAVYLLPIPPKVDSHSSANWTPDPPQTGRLFQVKLDSRSEATLGVDVIYVLWVTSVNVGLRGHR